MTKRALLQKIIIEFKQAGIECAEADAKILACFAFSCDNLHLVTDGGVSASESEEKLLLQLSQRRLAGEPVQYITHEAPFMGKVLYVNENTLIPRPETEELVILAIGRIKELIAGGLDESDIRVLDLCTGSGCIAASIAYAFPKAQVTATDISEKALAVAKKNCPENVTLLKGNLFDAIGSSGSTVAFGLPGSTEAFGSSRLNEVEHQTNLNKWTDCLNSQKFHLILSNPPYIPTKTCKELSPDVRDHEPMLALDGGDDGLDLIRVIARDLPKYLTKGGTFLMEIGDDQGASCLKLFPGSEIIKDINGQCRIVKLQT